MFKRGAEKTNKFINNFGSKRNFSSGNRGDRFNNLLETIANRLPGGNVGALIVALNTFCYFMYLIWPRY